IPSFTIGLGARANGETENAELSPLRLGVGGALVGGVLLGTLACLQSLIPLDASNGALTIFSKTALIFVQIVLPLVFWMKAVDAGGQTPVVATVLGGFSQLYLANALPGIIVGIVLAKGYEEMGWQRVSVGMALLVVCGMGLLIVYGEPNVGWLGGVLR
ncbi:MAG: DUF4311 domain-containing protein, partial [Bacilli bacterium]